ncbi:MAG TPA: NAD(P)-dependent oxidoreductase [Saprospiraceae bacterium]|nr:NAD(P)-dependent oxidoreductase [Saprospiraceae bacterium]
MLKIGIIREEKIPVDARAPLAPEDAGLLNKESDIDIVVQPSNIRAFSDDEYKSAGVNITEDLRDRDVLLGIKEVPIPSLIPNKTYFFFSHTIKKQEHNRALLKALIDKHIRLIDYEALVNSDQIRLIAFGRFAGMVGAHNALWTWGRRSGAFHLPAMTEFHSYHEARIAYKNLIIPPVKIVLTGAGRVAQGAAMVLNDMGIRKISPMQYLTGKFAHPVYCQLTSFHYAVRKDGRTVEKIQDFYDHPDAYEADFMPFAGQSDIMINGIFWDPRAPAFFTLEDMKSKKFKIKVIADVTCDIAPASSIPSTIRATTIEEKIYGFNPYTHQETIPHQEGVVDMMTVDNLPNELPRDSSQAFGDMLIRHVLPELRLTHSKTLLKATVTDQGQLGPYFNYLKDFLERN